MLILIEFQNKGGVKDLLLINVPVLEVKIVMPELFNRRTGQGKEMLMKMGHL